MIHILEKIVDWIFWLIFTISTKVIYPLILLTFILCCASIIFLVIAYPIELIIDFIKEKGRVK